jgi:GNAT superfamily N-acetyltransferase
MARDTTTPTLPLAFHPVTPERWPDLEALFGERGAYGGCWCMWFRVTRSQFQQQTGEGNRRALKGIVDSGEVPGLLAYAGGEPAGWCSVAPRDVFPSLDRSRTLKRVDDRPVWSIVCFFVAKPFRGKGVMASLLRAAVDYAAEHGARIVEGYPVEPGDGGIDAASAFTGVVAAFRDAGFVEVVRRSEKRPIMRYAVRGR